MGGNFTSQNFSNNSSILYKKLKFMRDKFCNKKKVGRRRNQISLNCVVVGVSFTLHYNNKWKKIFVDEEWWWRWAQKRINCTFVIQSTLIICQSISKKKFIIFYFLPALAEKLGQVSLKITNKKNIFCDKLDISSSALISLTLSE